MLNKFLKIYFWWDISIISGSFLKTKLVPAKSRKLWVIKTKKIWMIENWLKDIFKWFHAVVYHFWFSSEAVKQKSFQKIDFFFLEIFFSLWYTVMYRIKIFYRIRSSVFGPETKIPFSQRNFKTVRNLKTLTLSKDRAVYENIFTMFCLIRRNFQPSQGILPT